MEGPCTLQTIYQFKYLHRLASGLLDTDRCLSCSSKLNRKFGMFGKSRKDYDDLLQLYKDIESMVHKRIRVHAPKKPIIDTDANQVLCSIDESRLQGVISSPYDSHTTPSKHLRNATSYRLFPHNLLVNSSHILLQERRDRISATFIDRCAKKWTNSAKSPIDCASEVAMKNIGGGCSFEGCCQRCERHGNI